MEEFVKPCCTFDLGIESLEMRILDSYLQKKNGMPEAKLLIHVCLHHPASSRRLRCMAVDERYTASQRLYPHPDIRLKKPSRLILGAKLAPCHSGSDDPRPNLDECPICFLFYPASTSSKL